VVAVAVAAARDRARCAPFARSLARPPLQLFELPPTEGRYHEQRIIKDGSTGHDYASLLGAYVAETCEYVEVEDPYVRSIHQVR